MMRAGADEIALADTVGYAHPAGVREAVRAAQDAVGARLVKLHLHDTMGLGPVSYTHLDVYKRQTISRRAARHARPPLWKTQPMKRTVCRARSSTSRVKTSGRA